MTSYWSVIDQLLVSYWSVRHVIGQLLTSCWSALTLTDWSTNSELCWFLFPSAFNLKKILWEQEVVLAVGLMDGSGGSGLPVRLDALSIILCGHFWDVSSGASWLVVQYDGSCVTPQAPPPAVTVMRSGTEGRDLNKTSAGAFRCSMWGLILWCVRCCRHINTPFNIHLFRQIINLITFLSWSHNLNYTTDQTSTN